MSDPQRREFLTAAAGIATLATLAGTQPAVAGDPSFMNNVPDPALSGKDLPTFKFALEKSDGKVIGNSYGKEATVTQLPISKGLAGVSMQIEPGAMPWPNRYIGNPLLTGMLNVLFRSGVSDAHCGLRAIRLEIVPQLHTAGRMTRGWLGVQMRPLDRAKATALGLEAPQGVYVHEVMPAQPAFTNASA